MAECGKTGRRFEAQPRFPVALANLLLSRLRSQVINVGSESHTGAKGIRIR
jgi:hypothetical protein